ncbi:MAG: type toxin-antitoxin system VapC family toxin [Phycisphaerales bacterium]|nr:type toxin-antitoxin system VapC family toxin [Phycisphaerales bacterium]
MSLRQTMFLLDTCALLWLGTDQSKIPQSILVQIQDPAVPVYVSAISAFEIGIKHAKGKLVLPLDPEAWFALALANHQVMPLAITWEIATRSAALPRIHNDPADRLIVATAQYHTLTVLTPDSCIQNYPGIATTW